jgi:hypothetical protein
MNKFALIAVSAIAVATTGCGSGGGSSSDYSGGGGGDTGSLTLSITDAPVDDASEVVIAMTEFEFQPVDGESFRVPVNGAPRALNLLDFTDGASMEIISDEDVPAGEYEWLRIFFDEDLSYIVIEEGGAQYPLDIPSGAQTGYKLNTGFTVPLNDSIEYILDFNVRKSITNPGPPGSTDYKMKPTVKIMNVAETGSVMGVIDSTLIDINNERCDAAEAGLTGNAVYAFPGAAAALDDIADPDTDGVDGPFVSDVVGLNEDSGNFEYHFMYLLPGTYTLAFTCSASADTDTDDDYPTPSDSGFDFDGSIEVTIVGTEDKVCDIPVGDGQSEPC